MCIAGCRRCMDVRTSTLLKQTKQLLFWSTDNYSLEKQGKAPARPWIGWCANPSRPYRQLLVIIAWRLSWNWSSLTIC